MKQCSMKLRFKTPENDMPIIQQVLEQVRDV